MAKAIYDSATDLPQELCQEIGSFTDNFMIMSFLCSKSSNQDTAHPLILSSNFEEQERYFAQFNIRFDLNQMFIDYRAKIRAIDEGDEDESKDPREDFLYNEVNEDFPIEDLILLRLTKRQVAPIARKNDIIGAHLDSIAFFMFNLESSINIQDAIAVISFNY